MTYKKLNVNSTVKVRLTNYGKAVLEEQHNELWSSLGVRNQLPYIPKKEDENGFVEFQLWELMEKLGSYEDWKGDKYKGYDFDKVGYLMYLKENENY